MNPPRTFCRIRADVKEPSIVFFAKWMRMEVHRKSTANWNDSFFISQGFLVTTFFLSTFANNVPHLAVMCPNSFSHPITMSVVSSTRKGTSYVHYTLFFFHIFVSIWCWGWKGQGGYWMEGTGLRFYNLSEKKMEDKLINNDVDPHTVKILPLNCITWCPQ